MRRSVAVPATILTATALSLLLVTAAVLGLGWFLGVDASHEGGTIELAALDMETTGNTVAQLPSGNVEETTLGVIEDCVEVTHPATFDIDFVLQGYPTAGDSLVAFDVSMSFPAGLTLNNTFEGDLAPNILGRTLISGDPQSGGFFSAVDPPNISNPTPLVGPATHSASVLDFALFHDTDESIDGEENSDGFLVRYTLQTTTAGPAVLDLTLDSFSSLAIDDIGGVPIALVQDGQVAVDTTCEAVTTATLTITLAGTGTGTVTVPGDGSQIDCSGPPDSGDCTEVYTVDDTASPIAATPDAHSVFAGWSGPDGSDCTAGSVTMDADKSCTATFDLDTHTLTVLKAGPGAADASVGGDGVFTHGATANPTASEGSHSVFTGWDTGDDCSGQGTTSPATVTMDADKTCTANFDLDTHTLAISLAGTGSGTVTVPGDGSQIDCPGDCSEVYTHGEFASPIAATPAGDSLFMGWSGSNGAQCATGSVSMVDNKSCIATFDLLPPETGTLTVIKIVDGGSASPGDFSLHVTDDNAGNADVGGSPFAGQAAPGTEFILPPGTYTVSEDPEPNYTVSFSGDCTAVALADADSKTCTVTNTFVPPATHTLTVSTAGTGSGTVTVPGDGTQINCSGPPDSGDCTEVYTAGDTAFPITATPDGSSLFAGWSGPDGSECATGSVSMDADKMCIATFDLDSDGDGIPDDVDPDDDNDGILDEIDTQPTVPSSDFTDGTTFGTVTDTGGLTVEVSDLDPAGVRISVSGAGGPATVDVCSSPVVSLELDPPEMVDVTCTSASVQVLIGPVEATFGTITAILDSSESATITEVSPGVFEVVVNSGSVDVGGQTIDPGDGPVTVTDTDGDGTVDSVDSDDDDDGIPDGQDQCPNTPPGETADENGCSPSQLAEVTIDIKPGRFPNPINLKSKGVIPVAILSNVSFDATAIDPSIVVFAGASPERWLVADVDGDAVLDLLLFFRVQDTDILSTDTEACLEGQTSGGSPFIACDSIKVVPRHP